MEITTWNAADCRPIDDNSIADAIARLLIEVPSELGPRSSDWPLLDALRMVEDASGAELARELLIVSTLVHRHADERRVAEYLLRHRAELGRGTRDGHALLSAARCAAEMDVRRTIVREAPTSDGFMHEPAPSAAVQQTDTPSVADFVVNYLADVVHPRTMTSVLRDALLDGVVIALEVAGRHHLHRGAGPSLLAMRPDARSEARLVTHLRRSFSDPQLARVVARLLLGGDGSAIDTGVLWWAAHARDQMQPPATTRQRWIRDVEAAARIAEAEAEAELTAAQA